MKHNRAAASANNEDEELKSAPHSFVVHKGNVGKHVQASIRMSVIMHCTAIRICIPNLGTLNSQLGLPAIMNVNTNVYRS